MTASCYGHADRSAGRTGAIALNKGIIFPLKFAIPRKNHSNHENDKMLVFVLDHHPIMSDMISMLTLRVCPAAKIFTANTFKQLDALMRKHDEPDFIFIEPQSTGFFGELSLNYIAHTTPNAKIIAITDIDSINNSKSSIKQGFWKILDKTTSTTEIILSLESIISPENSKPESKDGPIEPLRISRRHRQLIQLLDKGFTNREIATHLGITESTVKVHFARMFKILNVQNRLQALHFAKKNGWIL